MDRKLFFKRNKFFIYDPYFSFKEKLKLNLSLKQFPSWGTQFDVNHNLEDYNLISLDLRKNYKLNININI